MEAFLEAQDEKEAQEGCVSSDELDEFEELYGKESKYAAWKLAWRN